MSKNVKIEKIEEGEQAIETLSMEEDRMRSLYLQDGVIDDTEQEALDRIRGKIDTVGTRIRDLRAEVERNREIWQSHAADYADIQSRAQVLADFGHADAATVQASLEPIAAAASNSDQRWADATAGLENAMMNIEPIWQDYEAQKAARDEYDLLRPEFDTRLGDAEAAGPFTEDLTSQIAAVRGTVSAIDGSASAGQWVDALALLQEAVVRLEPVEAEVARIEAAKAVYESDLAALQSRLTEASTSEYATLAEQSQAIADKQTEMEAAAAAHDYETASGHVAELTPLVDDYLSRRDELDQERAAYESALGPIEGRLQAAASCEMATAGDVQQRMIDAETEMRALAEAEDFAGALAKLGDVETALTEYEAMIDDRDLYEARLAAIQDELIEYSTSRADRAYLQTIQGQMATIQSDMEAAAAAEDYQTALSKIGELEAKIAECIAEIEKKRQDYETARTNLNRQVSAAQSDANDAAPALDTQMAAITAKIPPIDTAAAAEDWAEAKNLIQPALDAVAAFNSAMLQAEAPNMTNGMSTSAIDLAARSPELVENLEELEAEGWQVVVGPAGGGSRCDKGAKILTIDANRFSNDLSSVQVMAHETGHAEYEHEPDTSSRDNFLTSMLGDEGMATMENIRVQREILENGGADIGISGNSANHAAYNAAYDQFLEDGDAEACRNAMGTIFGQGETVSGSSPPQNYEDYYGGWYDDNIGSGSPGPGASPDADPHAEHTH